MLGGLPPSDPIFGGLSCVGRVTDNKVKMTYREIFDLKFKKGYSTNQLLRRFPKDNGKVTEIALLQLPDQILKKMVAEEERLIRILFLKRRFLGQDDQGRGNFFS